jgi:phage-related protein
MKQKQNKGKKKVAIKDVVIQKEWTITLYTTADGKCPVNDYMKTLSKKDYAEMIDKIEYLRINRHNTKRPRAGYLRDKIYELRITLTKNKTRTLYFFYNDNNEIVLTHTFIKKTKEVPPPQIEKAIKYRNDFIQRHSKENINEK